MLKKKVDIKCDTSELLLEGVIHNFPTLLPILLTQEKGEALETTTTKIKQPGSLIDLLLFPKTLAFAAMPQCWSTEIGLCRNCQQISAICKYHP